MSILSRLSPSPGSKQSKKRLGRGIGSGLGKTAGRGQKGQFARGKGPGPFFEGGQMPIQRRVPKRGFRNVLAESVANVNVGQLDVFDNGTEVTLEVLSERGLVKGRFDRLKVLGNGELTKKLTVKAHAFSAGARDKIARAGGSAEVVSRSEGPEASSASA
jgi:large subunit ribosomal protein L15